MQRMFDDPPASDESGSGSDTVSIVKSRAPIATLPTRLRAAVRLLVGRDQRTLDALLNGGVLTGRWHVDRYDAPIEWYAEQAANQIGTLDDVEAVRRATSFADMPELIRVRADQALKANHRPYYIDGVEDVVENLFLTNGVSALWQIWSGNESAANSGAGAAGANALYNNAQAMIGVGDSSTAASAGQTDLQAASNKTYKAMDATYPSISTNQVSLRSTFASSDANYAWNEFVVNNRNGSNSTTSGGTTFNRLVSSQGTKASGQTWQPTLTASIS